MNDEDINAAIAEACGWRKEDGVYMWTANGIDCTCPDLWDWCNDLNAMHKAEEVLNHSELMDMSSNVFAVVSGELKCRPIWRATARQRAEAFLRTLGKWQEVEE